MASFWNGYSLPDFLFKDFDITNPEQFAGVFVSLVAVSIIYEGIRTLRDYLYGRFLTSSKRSPVGTRSKSSSPPSVRYNRSNVIEDELEQERLTGTQGSLGGAGDASTVLPSTSTRIQSEEEDILIDGEEGSSNKERRQSTPNPYQVTTFPANQSVSSRRRHRELMDLALSSFLHMIYITIGYILMLAVMTFNTYILVAVTAGVGIGFYLFGPIRNTREFKIFKYFETQDSYQEQLIPSHDHSKTESSSAGSVQDSSHVGDGDGRHGSEVMIGVQVHRSNQLTEST